MAKLGIQYYREVYLLDNLIHFVSKRDPQLKELIVNNERIEKLTAKELEGIIKDESALIYYFDKWGFKAPEALVIPKGFTTLELYLLGYTEYTYFDAKNNYEKTGDMEWFLILCYVLSRMSQCTKYTSMYCDIDYYWFPFKYHSHIDGPKLMLEKLFLIAVRRSRAAKYKVDLIHEAFFGNLQFLHYSAYFHTIVHEMMVKNSIHRTPLADDYLYRKHFGEVSLAELIDRNQKATDKPRSKDLYPYYSSLCYPYVDTVCILMPKILPNPKRILDRID